MKMTYVGNLEAATIKDPFSDRTFTAKRGESVEIPEAVAKHVANPDWKRDEKSK